MILLTLFHSLFKMYPIFICFYLYLSNTGPGFSLADLLLVTVVRK